MRCCESDRERRNNVLRIGSEEEREMSSTKIFGDRREGENTST